MSIELVLIPVAIAITQSIGSRLEKKIESGKTFSITTIMKDEKVLRKTLDSYGCTSQLIEEKSMLTKVGDIKILFYQDTEGVFEALFDCDISFETAEEFIRHLQEEYTSIVQQETYLNLLARAKEQGLVLETEEVSSDNSIILTFKVN